MARTDSKSREHSTLNLPSATAVRSLAGPKVFDRITRVEQLSRGLLKKLPISSAEVEAAAAQIRAGYERWTSRYRRYVESAACEIFLSDFDRLRMAGMLNGVVAEGVGLATYFLGTLVERELFHQKAELWQPLVDCTRDVVFDVRETVEDLEKVLAKEREGLGGKKLFEIDVTQAECHERGERILAALERLCDDLYKSGVDVAAIQKLCNQDDVQAMLRAAEDGTRFIEQQGGSVMRLGGLMNATEGQGKVIPFERPTLELIDQAGERINKRRSTMGLPRLNQEDRILHEVLRHWLVMADHPYIPSPYLEGRYASGAGSKSNLEKDLLAIAEESNISFRTLQGYVDSGQIIAAWAARSLALAWKAARRVKTHYRYDIIEVKGQAIRGGSKGYQLVALGHAQAVPKGALTAQQVEELLAYKGRGGSRGSEAPNETPVDLAEKAKKGRKAPVPAQKPSGRKKA